MEYDKGMEEKTAEKAGAESRGGPVSSVQDRGRLGNADIGN